MAIVQRAAQLTVLRAGGVTEAIDRTPRRIHLDLIPAQDTSVAVTEVGVVPVLAAASQVGRRQDLQ